MQKQSTSLVLNFKSVETYASRHLVSCIHCEPEMQVKPTNNKKTGKILADTQKQLQRTLLGAC